MRSPALILPFFFSAVTFAFADQSPPTFTVMGGTDHERAVVMSIVQRELRGIADPAEPIVVKLVSPAEMHADVIASGGGSQSTSTDAPSQSSHDDVDGLYADDPPTITLLSGEDLPNMEMTLVHEFGHHVWSFFMNGNDHSAYNDIYARQLAANQLITVYAKESPEEGFAEAFSYYLVQPKKLKQTDSASFKFIETLTARLMAARTAQLQNVIKPSEQSAQ